MNLNLESYSVINPGMLGDSLVFPFVSESASRKIIKAILYSPLGNGPFDGSERELFNFGFGDVVDGLISDSAQSDNGDARKVFGTVLNTVPQFFDIYPDAIFRVGGSDSRHDFPDTCIQTCQKKCESKEKCRNHHRRIRIYARFLDMHLEILSQDYVFYGATAIDELKNEYHIENYAVKKMYNFIMVRKK